MNLRQLLKAHGVSEEEFLDLMVGRNPDGTVVEVSISVGSQDVNSIEVVINIPRWRGE